MVVEDYHISKFFGLNLLGQYNAKKLKSKMVSHKNGRLGRNNDILSNHMKLLGHIMYNKIPGTKVETM